MSLYKSFASIFENIHHKKIKKILKKINIKTFIDVGAFKGEFLNNLNQKKLKKIYLFEPQPYYYNNLKKKFKKKEEYKIYNLAISSKKTKTFFLLNNQITTSTLEHTLNKSHLLYFIKTKLLNLKYFKKITVKTDLLQNILKKKELKSCFLKIDTEGNDLEVLKGCVEIIKKIDYIMVEVKYLNFYKNNNQIDIYNFLFNHKFVVKNSISTFPYIYKDVLFENQHSKL